MGVRIFAVGVLVLGLVAGLAAGFLKQGEENDTLKVKAAQARAAENIGANFQAPPVDTDQPQPMPAGAKTKQLRAELEAQAKAKAAAQAKAEAARKAAKAKADAAKRAAAERASRSGRTTTGGGEQAPPTPVECSSYSGNRATGCTLLVAAGLDSGQMRCLDPLWKKESGWNHKASNSSSGAYGIPQSLPGSKMASEGADWRTNPVVQIKWGLKYIKGRYGDPCGAWAHSQNVGWY